jgi:hypothetical protein
LTIRLFNVRSRIYAMPTRVYERLAKYTSNKTPNRLFNIRTVQTLIPSAHRWPFVAVSSQLPLFGYNFLCSTVCASWLLAIGASFGLDVYFGLATKALSYR